MKDLLLTNNLESNEELITRAVSFFHINRNILASKDEIESAIESLSTELRRIPKEKITQDIPRLCLAVNFGLFDCAVNYAWNFAIINLRNKIKKFGIDAVSDFLNINKKNYNISNLDEMRDDELLKLCLALNLISQKGYFFLDHDRNIRNNYSAAHPSALMEESIDSIELVNVIHHCIKYACSDEIDLVGIDTHYLIKLIKSSEEIDLHVLELWADKLKNTNYVQQQFVITTLYGIYCDKDSNEVSRKNALSLLRKCCELLSGDILLDILNRYSSYKLSGQDEKVKATKVLFESLSLIKYLPSDDRKLILFKALKQLWDVHESFNNFYNEPPFAENLYNLSNQTNIPAELKDSYVEIVVMCRLGNGYGVSHNAVYYYDEMIKNFSPMEVEILINKLLNNKSKIYNFISMNRDFYLSQLKEILNHVDPESLSSNIKNKFCDLLKINLSEK